MGFFDLFKRKKTHVINGVKVTYDNKGNVEWMQQTPFGEVPMQINIEQERLRREERAENLKNKAVCEDHKGSNTVLVNTADILTKYKACCRYTTEQGAGLSPPSDCIRTSILNGIEPFCIYQISITGPNRTAFVGPNGFEPSLPDFQSGAYTMSAKGPNPPLALPGMIGAEPPRASRMAAEVRKK